MKLAGSTPKTGYFPRPMVGSSKSAASYGPITLQPSSARSARRRPASTPPPARPNWPNVVPTFLGGARGNIRTYVRFFVATAEGALVSKENRKLADMPTSRAGEGERESRNRLDASNLVLGFPSVARGERRLAFSNTPNARVSIPHSRPDHTEKDVRDSEKLPGNPGNSLHPTFATPSNPRAKPVEKSRLCLLENIGSMG